MYSRFRYLKEIIKTTALNRGRFKSAPMVTCLALAAVLIPSADMKIKFLDKRLSA